MIQTPASWPLACQAWAAHQDAEILPTMWRLDNTIQRYAWGSRDAIATLQGRATPTAEPEAELWMGAHPRAPSHLGGETRTLLEAIEAEPAAVLGAAVAKRFGGRLPFLLKVLAAAEPLSLQAHPSAEQAQAGFDAEEAEGVPRDAPHRNYRDRSPKPELLCALGPFVAMCGFRDVEQTQKLVAALAVPGLEALAQPLWGTSERAGLRATVRSLLTMPAPAPLVGAVLAACRSEVERGSAWQRECAWVLRLGDRYPGDVGVVVALLLNLVELSPGEALFLPAGQLHCYLEGTAVEIMASSDNVLRGGLTVKHVDVPELLRTLKFDAGPVVARRARAVSVKEAAYETPAEAFRLSRVTLPPRERWSAQVAGPEVLLGIEGEGRVEGPAGPLRLGPGQSIFVAAADREYTIEAGHRGELCVFRATVNVPPSG